MTVTTHNTESLILPSGPKQGSTRQHHSFKQWWNVLGPAAIFLALSSVVLLRNPSFLAAGGMGMVTEIAAPILLIALGQTIVLNVGSIDLSNAGMSLLGAILLAIFLPRFGVTTPLMIVVLTSLFGLINGVLVAYTNAPAFALTLGTLGIFESASLVSSKATAVYVENNDVFLGYLNLKTIATVPLLFYIAVAFSLLLWVMVKYSKVGRGMTSIGLNESGAIFSGLKSRNLKILAFTISGFMSGLGSIAIISQASSASPNGLGSDLLLPCIAASIIGGTSILGGIANPINVIFGSLTIALIPVVNSTLGVDAQAQNLVYGLAIITVAAVMINGSRRGIVK
jgi:ribose transport system permease protein